MIHVNSDITKFSWRTVPASSSFAYVNYFRPRSNVGSCTLGYFASPSSVQQPVLKVGRPETKPLFQTPRQWLLLAVARVCIIFDDGGMNCCPLFLLCPASRCFGRGVCTYSQNLLSTQAASSERYRVDAGIYLRIEGLIWFKLTVMFFQVHRVWCNGERLFFDVKLFNFYFGHTTIVNLQWPANVTDTCCRGFPYFRSGVGVIRLLYRR